MRKRRTKAQMELLSRQITRILERDHPQSVRHVFYRMTDPRLPEHVDKTEAGYATVQNLLVKLRRQALIPYGWIADATRQGYFTTTFNHPADAIEHVASFYRRNYWTTAPVYVEVWCESRSLAGVIVRDCKKYAVPLYPSGGFTSLSFAWSAAENIRANAGDRPTHLIYVGDYDPAGVIIDKKIEEELRGHLEDHEINFQRIAVNREQIDLMGFRRRKTTSAAAGHPAKARSRPRPCQRASCAGCSARPSNSS